jgi:hypothetical protein
MLLLMLTPWLTPLPPQSSPCIFYFHKLCVLCSQENRRRSMVGHSNPLVRATSRSVEDEGSSSPSVSALASAQREAFAALLLAGEEVEGVERMDCREKRLQREKRRCFQIEIETCSFSLGGKEGMHIHSLFSSPASIHPIQSQSKSCILPTLKPLPHSDLI